MTTTYSDITITGTLRVQDPNVDGFDYDLTWDDYDDRFVVTHGGKLAGWIKRADGGRWVPLVPAEFGVEDDSSQVGLAVVAPAWATAVAAIDAHWAEEDK
jgi:hypothetical protein